MNRTNKNDQKSRRLPRLADQQCTDGSVRWEAQERWAADHNGQRARWFALYDRQRHEFPLRMDLYSTIRAYIATASPRVRLPRVWYWKAGTRAQVEAYIAHTTIRKFMRDRVEYAMDRGQVA